MTDSSWLGKARTLWPSLQAAYRQGTPSPILNVASSGVRAVTRAGWSLFVPYFLSVSSYGIYSVFQTTVTAVTQAAVLGTPQTILREPTRELPMVGLFLHSLAIASVTLLVLGITVADYDWMFQALVAAGSISMILYLQLNVRAKARFRFAQALRSEAIGGVALGAAVLAIGIAVWSFGRGWLDYTVMSVAEILAALAIVVSLLSGKTGRLTSTERGVRDTRRYLPSVYSVGVVVLFDVILFRRLEVYFLQESPDGLQGVAVFGLATQIFNMFLLVPGAVLEAWGPSFARSYGSGPSEFTQTVREKLAAYRKLYAIVVVASACAAPLLIGTIFQKYSAWTWHITAFVAIRIICYYVGFHSAVLYASRRERWLYAPVAVGAAISVVSNLLLTLRWGVSGAIGAYALTQFAVAGGTMIVIRWSRTR